MKTDNGGLAWQRMAGGDLRKALERDIAEHGRGAGRMLGWYACGRTVMLCVAQGLEYLHSMRVRARHA